MCKFQKYSLTKAKYCLIVKIYFTKREITEVTKLLDLKSIRKNKGLTGEMVCKMAGLSVSALSMIETGKRRPSVELAKRIAAVLGFDWTLFYGDTDTATEIVGVPES